MFFFGGTGVLWLLFGNSTSNYRFLCVFYPVFLALMMALHAKDYYLVPAYPVFFAAGAAAWFAWAKMTTWRNALIGVYAIVVVVSLVLIFPFAVPVLRPQTVAGVFGETSLPTEGQREPCGDPDCHSSLLIALAGDILAKQVSGVYNALPPKERAVTGILASNYGQAGAIDNSWGKVRFAGGDQRSSELLVVGALRGYTGEEMIVINSASLDEMNAVYTSCIVAGMRNDPYTMPWEYGSIYLCHGRKKTYEADWKELKHYY